MDVYLPKIFVLCFAMIKIHELKEKSRNYSMIMTFQVKKKKVSLSVSVIIALYLLSDQNQIIYYRPALVIVQHVTGGGRSWGVCHLLSGYLVPRLTSRRLGETCQTCSSCPAGLHQQQAERSRTCRTPRHYLPTVLNFDCEAVSGSALKAAPAAFKSTEGVVAQWQPWPSGAQGPVAAGPPVRNPGNVLNVMGPCHELALLKQATRPFPRVRGLLLHDSEMQDLILWPVMVKQTDVSMHNNGQKITERNPLPLLSVCLSVRDRGSGGG